MKTIIDIQNVDFTIEGGIILSDISWRLHEKEHWVILGGNGAGKTTLLKLIRGDIWPSAGHRIYTFNGVPQESPLDAKREIALVSPELQDAYRKNNWNLTGDEVIYTGFCGSVWLFEKPDDEQLHFAEQIIELLNIGDLRAKSILEMSSGEAKKVLIARALASRPEILLLDEVCNDLDMRSRESLLQVIDAIADEGTQILYATHRADEIPSSMTHTLLLKQGAIAWQGVKDEASINDMLSPLDQKSGRFSAAPGSKKGEALHHKESLSPLLEIRDADIFAEHTKLLHKIRWRVDRGEHWAILGRNGAGKSTLLKLILGEFHPAAGGTVFRFGSGEGENIWEMRKRIGYISPSLQSGYDWNLTGEEVVQSGFFSSIGLYDEVSEAQKEAALKWISLLRIEKLCAKRIFTLSYGEQRKVLLARAMAHDPDILLLDEPCNGLDSSSRAEFLSLVETLAGRGTTILMATHHLSELIPSITHLLFLDNGQITAKGIRSSFDLSRELLQEE